MFFSEEYKNREAKLQEIRALGIDPFPHRFTPTHTLEKVVQEVGEAPVGNSEEAEGGKTRSVVVAGRLVLFRAMGKNAFAQIQDGKGKMQLMFNRDHTRVDGVVEAPLKFIEKKLDLGDFIGVEGHLFRTHKGELTVYVKKAQLLSKALLPLPEKHSGIVDKEVRYRKRWLDLISHDEVRSLFRHRSEIIQEIRHFFISKDFLEVETPILQNTYGGATAHPFMTHLKALEQEMFLRISPEITLKKLIIGGMERIFEIGKVFRNEGIDRTHNPEFTILEAYATYLDYNDLMSLVEELIETVALKIFGTTSFPLTTHEGAEVMIDFKAPWKRLTMIESLKTYAGIDIATSSDEQLRSILEKETPVDPRFIRTAVRGVLIATLFDEKVVPHLIAPQHIYDHPIETTPLCKPHRDPQKKGEGLVERFESFVLGKELCNAYTELNDPHIQRALFEEQAKKRAAGDDEAHLLDEEFLEALCQAMPPTAGLGIGIDRLVMLLTNTPSIRDILYFPLMRRE